jgi:putative DNA primase/helicase
VSNGVLDLEARELLPHTPNFLTMTALPYAYDPNSECPRWEKFVEEIFPNEKTRREFQKAFGYTLSSDQSQQKLFQLYGPARSGKGTIMRVLRALVGRENAVSPKLSEFREHKGMEALIGMKVATFPDERLGGNTLPIVERLLSISGEDDVSIPRKYLANWNGRLGLKIWIASNTLPAYEDASAVIASRFILFKLSKSFVGIEDTTLTKTLLGELPGILNWSITGLKMLREDKAFNQPAEALDAIDQMANTAAPIRVFVREVMVVSPNASAVLEKAHEAYKVWAEKAKHRTLSRNKFGLAIREAFPSVTRSWPGSKGDQHETLYGIGLVKGWDFSDPANDDDIMNAKMDAAS